MALTCSRCGTEVLSEAMYCPYCSLPRPKRGFAGASDTDTEETKHDGQTNPSVGIKSSTKKRKSPTSRRTKRLQTKIGGRLRLGVVSIWALVALLSVGIYIFVVPLVYSDQAEPKIVMSALNTLRHTPSSEAGLTIDARLSRELATSRRVKNLVAYQGWTVRPIKGTSTKVLMAYSYQEVGNVSQRAEWIADLITNTFTPQTDLAAEVNPKH